ncbi:NAD(P)H-hydrate dehydratase [Ideonella sp.]|uniref:NAD(P)H-hydrate dehydratase n=1 Tax=Ideonella sp. TaxID=1929293 RepID=UPI0035B1CE3B
MPNSPSGPVPLLQNDAATWLHDSEASRAIEAQALACRPAHALIEAAGLAVARWALAQAPHARHMWVAAGPGNNGGDGLVAARWLAEHGRQVHVTWHGQPDAAPADAAHARAAALAAGIVLHPPGAPPPTPPDLVIDALLGLGQRRPLGGALAAAVNDMAACARRGSRVLAVDVPTGLCADTGRRLGEPCVQAHATLCLLTAKPGLFTAHGRDAAGDIWFDDLGVAAAGGSARLACAADARAALAGRRLAAHASHKGRFGDVLVVGGAPGMEGAAQLAATAALRAGAGRVYVCAVAGAAVPPHAAWPELMHRPWSAVQASALPGSATVVCGCGGGDALGESLPCLLAQAPRLVLDADGLNAVAADAALARALAGRAARGHTTVLTPHPLEAARLLGVASTEVQDDRWAAARELARRFAAVVVLKGAGTVIASPDATAVVNRTGSARLASAGTGDVLAGWIGGCWSAQGTAVSGALSAATGSVWLHGRAVAADAGLPLPASRLAEAMAVRAEALGTPDG